MISAKRPNEERTIAGLVSVIVPTHNRARLLKQAVMSIGDQTYQSIEIIIVANGCNDETESTVQALQAHYRAVDRRMRIVFFNFPPAFGAAKARNLGLDHANGEYIAFLDDDDLWHADKISAQIKILQAAQCAIVGGNYFYLYGEQNQYLPAGRNNRATMGLKELSCENNLGSFSLCLTKKCYLGACRINERLEALQDWDLWLKILRQTNLPARVSERRLAYLRVDGRRISSCYEKVIPAQQLFLREWKTNLDAPSRRYHEMRIACLLLRMESATPWWKKFARAMRFSWRSLKTILRSCERNQLKRYIHYALLPCMDMGGWRMVRFKVAKYRALEL